MAGVFITFEGGEGAGKSTHIKLLADTLKSQGHAVVVTREPGGTAQGDGVRALLVTGDVKRWTPMAEALLNYAARDAHLNEVIRPALAAGKVVLCDRFMDSTRAYQGHAGGLDMAFIDDLERRVVGKTRPDLTLVFDLPAADGLRRARLRQDAGPGAAEDRFEQKDLSFHHDLRAGFLAIAAADPRRCKVVDATRPLALVGADVLGHVLSVVDG
jgi:dTMP kinase